MFKKDADKFWNKFEVGKVYYVSKGPFKWKINKFKTIANDYKMTLYANSEVEEAVKEGVHIPEYKHNFVKWMSLIHMSIEGILLVSIH